MRRRIIKNGKRDLDRWKMIRNGNMRGEKGRNRIEIDGIE